MGQHLSILRVSLILLIIDHTPELLLQLRQINLLYFIVCELIEVEVDELVGLFSVFLKQFQLFFVDRQQLVQQQKNEYFPSMVFFIVFFDSFQQFIEPLMTISEALF
jgi:hypothetical protein